MESTSTTGIAREQTVEAYCDAPESLKLHILLAIASALDDAHAQGHLVHNLEPASIALNGNPQQSPPTVRLETASPNSTSDPDLLQSLAPPQRAFYFSPERILGVELTPTSDQFSFGVLAYQLLLGSLPFTASTPSALFYQICTQAPQPTESNLADVLFRALAKEPQDRFSTCSAFIRELELATNNSPPSTSAITGQRPRLRAMAAAASHAEEPVFTNSTHTQSSSNTPPDASYLSERQRHRLELNDSGPPASYTKSTFSKWLLLLAIVIAAIGALLFTNRSHRSPLPQQVLDTHSAPISPPPADAASPAKRPDTASAPQPESRPPADTTSLVEKPEPPSAPQPESQLIAPLPKPTQTSSVRFDAEPAGVNVVVDNDAAQSCQTPCSLQLTNHRHTLVAALNGYRTEQRIINVPETLSINIPLEKRAGTLVVTSDPSGSEIHVDGRRYGTTPATLTLSPGPHEVSVQSGGRRQQETIDITADSIQAKKFAW